MEYSEYLEKKRGIAEAKQAATRCWAVVLGHLVLPPVSSLYYAAKTNFWKPFWWGTGVAVACVPLSIVDMGITVSIAPPLTSGAILITNAQSKRSKLQIFDPEQADAIVYEQSNT